MRNNFWQWMLLLICAGLIVALLIGDIKPGMNGYAAVAALVALVGWLVTKALETNDGE
jgi:uncharacterized membrane protein YhaH (DUF805 family)